MSNVIPLRRPDRWQTVADMAEAMDADPTREGDFLNEILEAFPEPLDPELDPADPMRREQGFWNFAPT